MDPQRLLELARKNGAEAAEVYVSEGLGRSANFEANRLKQVETGDEEGVALRLWRNGRPGLAVARGPVDDELLVEKAIALAQFGQLEEPELASESLNIESPPYSPTPIEQLIAWGEQTIALVRERYAEVICGCTYSEEVGTVRLLNSLGLDMRYTSHHRSGYLGVEWVRGEDFLQVYDGETVLGDPSPEAVATPVLERLDWSEVNCPTRAGTVPVLFTAKAATVLLGAVSAALNGRQVLQEASPWSQKRGETVLSPLLTLSQDPQLAPYITPFDDEGTPAIALEFVRAGRLETFYADRRIARRLGLRLGGNGLRSDLGSYPQPGLFNLVVAAGNHSFAQLLSRMDDGIVVDQVLGEGAGLSGEFSVNIDLGFRVKGGEIVGRIKDTMVAGNAYDALGRLAALGSERLWEGNALTAALLVESLAVTGRAD
ncbi:TldD/PmbA family protein [Gloeobacter morelensis]|uniref:TldD/PmbA family protein n=1 Tax=Gloeobacter morelensis MG652769 TaxID=2781736 RepID=A0ABY3PIQ9_9CYAN|nr:TldD/PmbA family protein [Gloeobacter morelensis]UFP93474.1 TldD/PmbA family protein [Gloeobacter morelensis MG652769]